MMKPLRCQTAILLFLALVLGVWGGQGDPVFAAKSLEATQAQAEELLQTWRAKEALEQVEILISERPQEEDLLVLKSQALFHLGRYEEALETAQAAQGISTDPQEFSSLVGFIDQTLRAREGFKTYESPHFRLSLDPGQDGLLVEMALEAAEKSYEALGEALGWRPEEPIRIEIYPTAQRFQWASGLSRRDIEVTGAVGITAFNKLALFSPRALARGYRWLDSLSHEYVHYALIFLTRNNAPIWFHEGMAKFFETRWRSADLTYLSPSYRTLLATALQHNEFVSFEAMEPSLVELPNPRQVHLAYAEGASAVDFILREKGREGLLGILRSLSEDPERKMAEVITESLQQSMDEFEASWKEDLGGQGFRPLEGVWIPQYRVRGEGDPFDEAEEFRALQSAVARNHLRLGDLLLERGRVRPALMEYGRALERSPGSPYLRRKLAQTLLSQGKAEQAETHLEEARQVAPDYVATYTLLGHLHLRAQRFQEARAAYEESLQINPFDPSVHEGLALVYRELGEEKKARDAEEAHQRLLRSLRQGS